MSNYARQDPISPPKCTPLVGKCMPCMIYACLAHPGAYSCSKMHAQPNIMPSRVTKMPTHACEHMLGAKLCLVMLAKTLFPPPKCLIMPAKTLFPPPNARP